MSSRIVSFELSVEQRQRLHTAIAVMKGTQKARERRLRRAALGQLEQLRAVAPYAAQPTQEDVEAAFDAAQEADAPPAAKRRLVEVTERVHLAVREQQMIQVAQLTAHLGHLPTEEKLRVILGQLPVGEPIPTDVAHLVGQVREDPRLRTTLLGELRKAVMHAVAAARKREHAREQMDRILTIAEILDTAEARDVAEKAQLALGAGDTEKVTEYAATAETAMTRRMRDEESDFALEKLAQLWEQQGYTVIDGDGQETLTAYRPGEPSAVQILYSRGIAQILPATVDGVTATSEKLGASMQSGCEAAERVEHSAAAEGLVPAVHQQLPPINPTASVSVPHERQPATRRRRELRVMRADRGQR